MEEAGEVLPGQIVIDIRHPDAQKTNPWPWKASKSRRCRSTRSTAASRNWTSTASTSCMRQRVMSRLYAHHPAQRGAHQCGVIVRLGSRASSAAASATSSRQSATGRLPALRRCRSDRGKRRCLNSKKPVVSGAALSDSPPPRKAALRGVNDKTCDRKSAVQHRHHRPRRPRQDHPWWGQAAEAVPGTLDRKEAEKRARVMDSNDQERRGITILAKNTAIKWNGYNIKSSRFPVNADFGGEVARAMSMVDSVLLVVTPRQPHAADPAS